MSTSLDGAAPAIARSCFGRAKRWRIVVFDIVRAHNTSPRYVEVQRNFEVNPARKLTCRTCTSPGCGRYSLCQWQSPVWLHRAVLVASSRRHCRRRCGGVSGGHRCGRDRRRCPVWRKRCKSHKIFGSWRAIPTICRQRVQESMQIGARTPSSR